MSRRAAFVSIPSQISSQSKVKNLVLMIIICFFFIFDLSISSPINSNYNKALEAF